MNDDLDDLDHALFALPLEAPPAGLRASILNATIYAPRAVHAVEPLARPWELLLSGVALAVATWLVIAVATSHSLASAFASNAMVGVRALGDPMTLEWLAAGAIATAAFWYVSDANLRLPTRGART